MAKKKKVSEKDQEVVKIIKKSIIRFIWMMWKLKPQPVKEEYKNTVKELVKNGKLEELSKHPEYWDNKDFIFGKHITWQQWITLLAVELATAEGAVSRISVSSGHGIGKSCAMSWVLIWYLFVHKDAQVACTSPSENQMFDVLWKEVSIWIEKVPEPWKSLFDWQSKYIRIKDKNATEQNSENRWFARAKTARKESPEALAGVHGEHVCILVDEASGVPEAIYETMEGAQTGKSPLVMMFSNHTRLVGYFHESHYRDKAAWQAFTFSSIDSPVVDEKYVKRIIEKYGADGDEYRIRVLGLPPMEDMVDDEGYAPILKKSDLVQIERRNLEDPRAFWSSRIIMGIDPAGEGYDKTSWVIRDGFKAQIIHEQKESNEMKIADITIGLCGLYGISYDDVYVDMFGVGAKTCLQLAKLGKDINGIDVGDKCDDEDDDELYINIRARNYYGRLKKWIRSGGELVKHKEWEEELISVKYARATERNSRIQIMSKKKMKKQGYKSPNHADALMLTFCNDEDEMNQPKTMMPSEREAALRNTNGSHEPIQYARTMNCSNNNINSPI